MNIKKLRKKILDLAIRGKLVPQNPNDEPASVLLERIREEKERLIKEGKIKRDTKEKTGDQFPYQKVPFGVPEGWEWVSGSKCFKPMESKKPIGETFRYIDINSIDNKKHIITEARYINVSDAPSRASRSVDVGDTLFSMVRPYLENIAYVDKNYENCIASTGFFVCKPNQILFSKYLYYLMLSSYVIDGLNIFMKGDNSPSINNDNLTTFLYPIPPLFEQKRIVQKIEECFNLIYQIEKNKLSLEQFIKQTKSKVLDLAIRGKLVPQDPNDEPASVLLEKIRNERKEKKPISANSHYPFEAPKGWVWCEIKDISDAIQYGYTGSAITIGKYKMLRITDIQDNFVDWETVPFVEIDDKKAENYLLVNNDIVFARTGATVGKSFLIKSLTGKSVFASYLIRIQLKEDLDTQYVKYFFESDYYWKQIEEKSVGTGQPNVNGTLLGELQIPIPPLSEQQRIISKIEQIFTQLDEIEKSIN